jgi:hypothetical protein
MRSDFADEQGAGRCDQRDHPSQQQESPKAIHGAAVGCGPVKVGSSVNMPVRVLCLQFAARLPQHAPTAMQRECRHQAGDDEIGPC